jgi:hypothetical protein
MLRVIVPPVSCMSPKKSVVVRLDEIVKEIVTVAVPPAGTVRELEEALMLGPATAGATVTA